eukprot:1152275-Pelagomonas_calceolata.AAC.10
MVGPAFCAGSARIYKAANVRTETAGRARCCPGRLRHHLRLPQTLCWQSTQSIGPLPGFHLGMSALGWAHPRCAQKWLPEQKCGTEVAACGMERTGLYGADKLHIAEKDATFVVDRM